MLSYGGGFLTVCIVVTPVPLTVNFSDLDDRNSSPYYVDGRKLKGTCFLLAPLTTLRG